MPNNSDSNDLPKFLYRFRSLSKDYSWDEISHAARGEIYMPSTSMINDPFDLNPIIIQPTVVEAGKALKKAFGQNSTIRRSIVEEIEGRQFTRFEARMVKRQSKPGYSTTLREIEAFKKVAKTFPDRNCVACFSERFSSPLMWAHYADNHAGVCLKYLLEMSENITDHMAPIKVGYSETRPSISFEDILDFTKRGGKRVKTDDRHDVLGKLMLTKGLDWQYEKEWRIVVPAELGNRYRYSSHLKLHSVMLGFRTSEDHASKVGDHVRSKVPILRVEPDKQSFEMILVQHL